MARQVLVKRNIHELELHLWCTAHWEFPNVVSNIQTHTAKMENLRCTTGRHRAFPEIRGNRPKDDKCILVYNLGIGSKSYLQPFGTLLFCIKQTNKQTKNKTKNKTKQIKQTHKHKKINQDKTNTTKQNKSKIINKTKTNIQTNKEKKS